MAPRDPLEWDVRDPDDHAVYIMGHLDPTGWVTRPTKVGVSKNPTYRLKQVQAAEPGHIVLVAQFNFWKRDHAFRVEQAFHKACKRCRVRGEWFDMEPFHAVGVMTENLRSFVEDFLGTNETYDEYHAYDHLNLPGFDYLAEIETFGHRQVRRKCQ